MDKLAWFNEARYGLFIHWGPYAVAGRGEWVRNRERISQAEYAEKYARHFTAERYDPAEWAKLAVDAGMGYVVLTTRHHDGYCLWDTKTTDYNAAKLGPERDLVRPFVEAVREAGLKVGFYYSFADWSHADYPDAYARDWPTGWPDESKRRSFVEYTRRQLEELMTGYGTIDMLWYDGCIPSPTGGADTNSQVYQWQPDILINERNGGPYDFECSEQTIKPAAAGMSWEACLTLNENWGYHAGDDNWKSPRQVAKMLLECAGGGGNLLINAGPRADGTIPGETEKILREVGAWLRRNPGFLANSSRSPFSWNNWGRITTNGNRAYLHLWNAVGPELCLAEIRNRVLSARMLASGAAVTFEQSDDRLILSGLPSPLPDSVVTTIELELEGTPEPLREQKTFWIPD